MSTVIYDDRKPYSIAERRPTRCLPYVVWKVVSATDLDVRVFRDKAKAEADRDWRNSIGAPAKPRHVPYP